MALVVQPRLPTGPGRIQLLVLELGAVAVSSASFWVEGVPTLPTVLRPLSSVRGPKHGVPVGSNQERAFAGVYEFRGLPSGARLRIRVEVGTQSQVIDTRTLPDRVPGADAGGFDILLASCFHSAEANHGGIRNALARLRASLRPKKTGVRAPDISLLMGDQVYLDLPALVNFPESDSWLAHKFERDYVANWSFGLSELLSLAPSACLPDDHEFWNNAPHASPFIQNSLTRAGRQQWSGAAQACYLGIAKPLNARGTDTTDDPLIVDVHPISIFLADGRSKRDSGFKFTVTADCLSRLRDWVADLNRYSRVGVFVTGQSLLREPASSIAGGFGDYEQPNYADYASVLAVLSRAERRLVLLTGDVHFGRVTSVLDGVTRLARMQEVVVSPLSLVTTPVADTWGRFVGRFNRDPWPRHRDPEPAPAHLPAPGTLAYPCATLRTTDGGLAKVKGDQVGLLSFDWDRARLRASVKYFSIHSSLNQTTTVPLFDIPLVG